MVSDTTAKNLDALPPSAPKKKRELVEHIEAVHLQLYRTTCPYPDCGKSIVNNRGLHNHIDIVRLELLKHACKHHGRGCEERFNGTTAQTIHTTYTCQYSTAAEIEDAELAPCGIAVGDPVVGKGCQIKLSTPSALDIQQKSHVQCVA